MIFSGENLQPLYLILPELLQLVLDLSHRERIVKLDDKVLLPAADDDLLSNFSIDLRAAKIAWKDKEGQGEERGVSYLR